MIVCKHCGAILDETAKFCTSCGERVAADAQHTQQQPNRTQQFQQQQGQMQFRQEQVHGYGTIPPRDESEEKWKIWAILGYIFPIIFFIPLVADAKTPYIKFHANQQLLLLLLGIASYLLKKILGWIPLVSILVNLVTLAIGIFIFVCAILGIVSAVNGTRKPLPLIGEIIIIK